MATATYVRGEVRTARYTAAADIAVDQMVIMGLVHNKKSRIGVARAAIPTGTTGIVAVSGVFRMPKVSAAVIKAGEAVSYDADGATTDGAIAANALSVAIGDVGEFGCALSDAGDGVTTIEVDIAEPGTYKGA